MNNQSKYLLSLVVGTIFLIMIFANFFIAWAENSSQVIIKESSEHTTKPVVRPSRKNINTKYNVKVGPIKIITPKTQNKALDNRSHGAKGAISPSNANGTKFKTDIKIKPIKKMSPVVPENSEITDGDKSRRQRPFTEGTGISGTIGPIKKISPETSEGLKDSDGKDGRRQRSFPERSGIAGEIQKKSISVVPDQTDNIKKRTSKSKEVTIMPIDQTKKGDKKFKVQVGPVKVIDGDGTKISRSPSRERTKVTRIRAWKLDESGNKTNEKIIDDNNVIKGINQSPSE